MKARVLRESIGYLLASVVALACDVAVLAMLVRLHADNVSAAAIGYCAGLAVHYLLATRFVFHHRRYRDVRLVETGLYAVTGVVGLVLSAAIVWLGDVAGMGLPVSKAIAVVASFVTIYVLRRWLLFAAPSPTSGRPR